jgi:hypothetical protein
MAGQQNYGMNGATTSEDAASKSAKIGSDALRTRILAMFDRTARAHGISLEDAARLHLCPAVA